MSIKMAPKSRQKSATKTATTTRGKATTQKEIVRLRKTGTSTRALPAAPAKKSRIGKQVTQAVAEAVTPNFSIGKASLVRMLKTHARTITFTKLDGTTRVMRASLTERDTPETYRQKSNPDQITVYDLDDYEWKTIRLGSITKPIELA